jgi:DNA invertase Pin-like site-specific DNA recombinase
VGTEEQAAEGYSLDAQRAKLAGYAVAADLELVAVVADEGISGKRTDNRPALQEALRRLEDGEAAALVVVKLDRLSRSTADVLALVERCGREGWSLHSLAERLDTASAMGRFVVTIFAALAQAEREVIGERTKAAMSHMKANGLLVGAVPFGFDLAADGRTLAPNAAEQAIVTEVRSAVAAGRTLSGVARDLNARGILTKRGRKWTHTQVGNLVAA